MNGELKVGGRLVGRVVGGAVHFEEPMQWHSVSDFDFTVLEDKGACLSACCTWKRRPYHCHIAPQEAQLDWEKLRLKVQQVPPYD